MTRRWRGSWATGGALLLIVAGGAGMAVQARVSAGLATLWGDAIFAAAWAIVSGLALLASLTASMPSGRRGVVRVLGAVRTRRLPWWALFGGAAGACFVIAQTSTTPIIGVALFTVAVVAGQALGGILMDRIGIAGMPSRPITPARALGTTISLAAVLLAAWGQLGAAPWWAYVLPFAAGVATAWQQAVNGEVGAAAGNGVVGATVNFACGTLLVSLVLLVTASITAPPSIAGAPPFWLLSGGALGAFAAFAQVATVRRLGILALGLGQLVGQFAGALTIDAALPVPGHRLSALTAVGTAIALAGAIVAIRPAAPRR